MEGMEGLVVSRFGWLMITHLSVEKDESNKKCQYKPMDIHMLYIYINVNVGLINGGAPPLNFSLEIILSELF